MNGASTRTRPTGTSGSRPSTNSVRVVVDSDYRHYVPATQSATCQNLNSERRTFSIVTVLLLTISALAIFDLYLLMAGL
jgi:cobalamin biosynthesis Mg chelatase CobN